MGVVYGQQAWSDATDTCHEWRKCEARRSREADARLCVVSLVVGLAVECEIWHDANGWTSTSMTMTMIS